MRRELATACLGAMLLAGCGSAGDGGGAVQSASAASAPRKPYLASVRQPSRTRPPVAQIQAVPGLEGVIGAGPAELTRQFGTPRLDVVEGDARKLQFSGEACVLDIYLYPSAPGREPQATYIDARRASDGQDVERTACVRALKASR
jgi:hypothetical protein